MEEDLSDEYTSCDEEFSMKAKESEFSQSSYFSALLFTTNLVSLVFDLKFLSPMQEGIIGNFIKDGGGLRVSDVDVSYDEVITLVDEKSSYDAVPQGLNIGPLYSIRYVLESVGRNRLMPLEDYKVVGSNSERESAADAKLDSEKVEFSYEATLMDGSTERHFEGNCANEAKEPESQVHEKGMKIVGQNSIYKCSSKSVTVQTSESRMLRSEQTLFVNHGNKVAITTQIEAVPSDSGNTRKPVKFRGTSPNNVVGDNNEVGEKPGRNPKSEVAVEICDINSESNNLSENEKSLSIGQCSSSEDQREKVIDGASPAKRSVHLVPFNSVFAPLKRSPGKGSTSDLDIAIKMAYSYEEDFKLLKTVIKRRLYCAVKGRTMWTDLEAEGLLEGRTWQSMKERYKKRILPQIYRYAIPFEDAKKCVHAFGFETNMKQAIIRKCEAFLKRKASTLVKKCES